MSRGQYTRDPFAPYLVSSPVPDSFESPLCPRSGHTNGQRVPHRSEGLDCPLFRPWIPVQEMTEVRDRPPLIELACFALIRTQIRLEQWF